MEFRRVLFRSRPVPLKANTDAALKTCPGVKTVLVVQHTGGKVGFEAGRDIWFHEEAAKVPATCAPEPMGAEDPLFILYTSGRSEEHPSELQSLMRTSYAVSCLNKKNHATKAYTARMPSSCE